MTINNSVLMQTLRNSANPNAGGSKGDINTSLGDQESAFLDLMKGLAKGKTDQPVGQKSTASEGKTDGEQDNASAKKTKGKTAQSKTEGLTEQLDGGATKNDVKAGDAHGAKQAGGSAESAIDRIAQALAATGQSAVRVEAAAGQKTKGQAQAQSGAAQTLAAAMSAAKAGSGEAASGQTAKGQTGGDGKTDLFSKFAVNPETVRDGSAAKSEKSGKVQVDIGSVKVLKQETHFAPTLRLSPVQQVGDAVSSFLKQQVTEMRASASPFAIKSEGPVLKTLEIQLQPIELGTVKVSLKMVGDQVEVSLRASNPQTVELLKQDRQLLDQMLRATGHKPDAITIQGADDRPVAQSPTSSSSQNTQSGQGDSQFGNGQGTYGGQNGQRGGEAGGQRGDDRFGQIMSGQENGSEFGEEVSDVRQDDNIYL
ncbi:flagellar hook-length control protein FliK [Roseibium hamelinense]|uniref:Flagellar hook-length control protein FliK n=1 Tax=Roseibium hamelinense TaxID=150831 RepID=A0A562TJH1_9HYPH|nr:flagellar hook-length control protein FliK [Roseibium hamelinense]MTI45915.1 flagellar hook-length control protein FliK [Roseibium hamelinense]TWI92900.1 flagellar hook-length control protein FliK [Roseibium hamelinense]